MKVEYTFTKEDVVDALRKVFGMVEIGTGTPIIYTHDYSENREVIVEDLTITFDKGEK